MVPSDAEGLRIADSKYESPRLRLKVCQLVCEDMNSYV